MTSTSSANGSDRGDPIAMEGTLSKAKKYMQSSDYSRAIVLLQRARNLCNCISVFREKNNSREHSSAKSCLRDTLLSAALDEEDDAAVYKAATKPCSCGVPKLACDDDAHMDVLDKLAACSAAMGKSEAAIGFAAAAIHLNPRSPVGYCRLSKLIRTRTLDEATLRSDVDNEIMAMAIVRHGVSNVKTYGDVGHPLYKVLQVISKKLYRKDPLKMFPPEIKVMILSHLDTLELIRCQRVSKRWLFAIRDDPNLWTKLLFIFTGNKHKPARLAKGMTKVISRSRRASTLSLAPAIFDPGQYQPIFSQLQNLRHLHLESDKPFQLGLACAEPPRRLTKLTFFVLQGLGGEGENNVWFRSILAGSASTLEELQVLGQTRAISQVHMPKLRVLRARSDYVGPGLGGRILRLDGVSARAPCLEQLCLEGKMTVHGRTNDYLFPNLKVLAIPCVNVRFDLQHNHHLIPPGIRVIDEATYLPRGDSILSSLEHPADWASLEYLRCISPVGPDALSRMLAPSLANGKLKTLSLASPLEELKDMQAEAPHVQALGLVLDSRDNPLFLGPRYIDWVAKFPNAHTFTVYGESGAVVTALAELIRRPGTKRIFERSLRGVQRDQLLEEAANRGIEVIPGGFPLMFPWTLEDEDNDDDGDGESVRQPGRGQVDVVEQWRNARGRLDGSYALGAFPRVSNQPFFRE